MWKDPWQVLEWYSWSLEAGVAAGQDGAGEGRLVGWAGLGCAGACQRQGFLMLGNNGKAMMLSN